MKSRYDRLREAGYLTVEEMAKLLGIAAKTVQERRKRGLLKGVRLNDLHEYLYEYPGADAGASKTTPALGAHQE
jgi:Helix-turn-helix domain